jgi:hypothetical protein
MKPQNGSYGNGEEEASETLRICGHQTKASSQPGGWLSAWALLPSRWLKILLQEPHRLCPGAQGEGEAGVVPAEASASFRGYPN